MPVTRSTNPLSPVQEFDALGNEVLYRTMTPADFRTMQRTGAIPATSETFVSPLAGYSQGYEGVLVRVTTKPGTMTQLSEIGVTGNHGTAKVLPEMSRAAKGWTANNAMFKLEGTGRLEINGGAGVVNTGLGRGKALEIFNSNIVKYERIR